MKHTAKRFAALLAALVLALCLSIPAFAAAPLVRDEMGLFDADTYSQLEASAEAASDGHDCDVYFLVVDSIGDTDQRQYAKDYYLATVWAAALNRAASFSCWQSAPASMSPSPTAAA